MNKTIYLRQRTANIVGFISYARHWLLVGPSATSALSGIVRAKSTKTKILARTFEPPFEWLAKNLNGGQLEPVDTFAVDSRLLR